MILRRLILLALVLLPVLFFFSSQKANADTYCITTQGINDHVRWGGGTYKDCRTIPTVGQPASVQLRDIDRGKTFCTRNGTSCLWTWPERSFRYGSTKGFCQGGTCVSPFASRVETLSIVKNNRAQGFSKSDVEFYVKGLIQDGSAWRGSYPWTYYISCGKYRGNYSSTWGDLARILGSFENVTEDTPCSIWTNSINGLVTKRDFKVTRNVPDPTIERFTANGVQYATSVEYCKDTLRLDWETKNAINVLVSGPRIDSTLQQDASKLVPAGSIYGLRPKTVHSPALYTATAKFQNLSSSPEPVAVYVDRGVSCFEECLINQAESIFPRATLLRQNESVKRCVGSWYNGQCCTGVLVGDRCAGSWGPGYDAQSDDVILCNALEWGTKTVTRIAKEPTSAFQAAGVKIMCLLHFAGKIYDKEKDQCKGRLPDENFAINEYLENAGKGFQKGTIPGFFGGLIGGVIGGVPLPFVSCIPGLGEAARLFVGFFASIFGEVFGGGVADQIRNPPDPNKLGEGLGFFVGDILGREMGYELGSSLWGLLDTFGIKIADIDIKPKGYKCPSGVEPPHPPPPRPDDKKNPESAGTPNPQALSSGQLKVGDVDLKSIHSNPTETDWKKVTAGQQMAAIQAAYVLGTEEVQKSTLTPIELALFDQNKAVVIPKTGNPLGDFMKNQERNWTAMLTHVNKNFNQRASEQFAIGGQVEKSLFVNEFTYAIKKTIPNISDSTVRDLLYKKGTNEFSDFVIKMVACWGHSDCPSR